MDQKEGRHLECPGSSHFIGGQNHTSGQSSYVSLSGLGTVRLRNSPGGGTHRPGYTSLIHRNFVFQTAGTE